MCYTKSKWGDWETGSSLTKFLDQSEDGSSRLSTHGTWHSHSHSHFPEIKMNKFGGTRSFLDINPFRAVGKYIYHFFFLNILDLKGKRNPKYCFGLK